MVMVMVMVMILVMVMVMIMIMIMVIVMVMVMDMDMVMGSWSWSGLWSWSWSWPLPSEAPVCVHPCSSPSSQLRSPAGILWPVGRGYRGQRGALVILRSKIKRKELRLRDHLERSKSRWRS